MRHNLLLAALALLLVSPTPLQSSKPQESASDRIIVKMKRGVDASRADELRKELRAEVKRRFKLVDAELWSISGSTVEEAVAKCRRDPRIEYAEPDYLVSMAEVIPNDSLFGEQWGLHNTGQQGGQPDADIDAPAAWEITTGNDVVIGLLDSGVDYLHPDLGANIWTNVDEIEGNGVDDDGNGYIDDVHGWDFVNDDNDPMDDEGHGTHSAGTLAAIGNNDIGAAGVCWHARIMALKFLDVTGFGYVSDAVLALEYAASHSARLASCSWGTYSYSETLRSAIAACGEVGMLFVAPAGNDGTYVDNFAYYPACYDLDNIISVAATDRMDSRAGFSNVGATSVDLGAPGADILSTAPNAGYDWKNGTSMAAQHVAGAVALLWSVFGGYPGSVIKSSILETVDPLPSLAGVTVSGGRLNVGAALNSFDSIRPAAVTDLAVAAVGSNTARLVWTATGDDSLSGQASIYDVRYSLSPIEPGNFDAASQSSGEPAPGEPGSAETFTVRGLDFNTTCYFALRVVDDRGNRSAVSNCVSGTTLGIPAIAVSPDSLADSLSTAETSVHAVTIRNTAEGTLDFSIQALRVDSLAMLSALDTGLSDLAGVEVLYDASHGQYDMPTYYAAIVGDLRSRGANVVSSADSIVPGGLDAYDVVLVTDGLSSLPWTGDEIGVLSGWVRAGGGLLIAGDSRIESYNPILNALASGIQYDYLVCGAGSTSRIYALPTTEGVSSLYVSHQISRLVRGGAPAYGLADDASGVPVAAASLSGAGRIVVIAHDMLRADCIDGDDNRLFGNRAVDWLAAGARWLTALPASGTVAAGESLAVAVTFDARELYGGEYRSIVRISSNDPVTPEVDVPATLHVAGIPDIAVSDTLIDFGRVWIGSQRRDSIVVSNLGTGALSVSDVTVSDPRFGVDTASFTLELFGERTLVVTGAPDSPGIVTGTLSLASDDPDEPAVNVRLRFEGVYPPAISVAPDSMLVGLFTGGTVVREATIENTGGDTLTYVVREGVSTAPPIGTDVDLLIIYSASGYPPEIRDSLLALPGIGIVDYFDGGAGPPSLGALLDYDCVILTNYFVFNGEDVLGNVLADYVDRGGGVIMTHGSFVGNYSVEGRFWNEGYCPFERASQYTSPATLGAYDANHPIMAGVLSASTSGPALVSLRMGSNLVASWTNGTPCVATRGERVVGITISLNLRSAWSGSIPLLLRNAARWASGGNICWADAEPRSGSVPPGGSTTVLVTFRSTALCAPFGVFTDSLIVASNDPVTPGVPVRLQLAIVGEPDIAVEDTLLDYGVVLIGDTATTVLTVSNYGVTPLHVSGLAIDEPAFSVDVDTLIVSPHEEREVLVSFIPVLQGAVEGTLTIASDDPDEPSVAVALRGLGLLPGEITVTPDSLDAVLAQGDSLVSLLMIGNGGVADLAWRIYPLTGSSLGTYTLPAVRTTEPRVAEDVEGTAEPVEDAVPNTGELIASLADLSGVRVLFDYSHHEYSHTYWWSTFIGDLTSRGATVASNWAPITPEVLADCDVYWITDQRDRFVESEVIALRDWVEAGGGLLFEGDNSDSLWNPLLTGLKSGIQYAAATGTNGTTMQVFPHVTTWDVSSVVFYNKWGKLSSVVWPSRLLVNDAGGVPSAACSAAGAGRIVAIADETFHNDYIAGGNNRLLGNQVIDWLAFGASWLLAAPHADTVVAGDTSHVEVTIAPRGLFGGEYDASLRIESNDPSNRVISVPVRLHYTGSSALFASADTLDFGPTIIGAIEELPVVVKNEGWDTLSVSAVGIEGAGYSASAAGFSLPVHGADTMIVAFQPSSVEPAFGTLTIYSNDPSNPARAIALLGSGLVPPEIVVTPAALGDTLHAHQSTSHSLTIENGGENELLFSLVEKGQGNRYLIVRSGNEVSAVRAALLSYPDMAAVDVFDVGAATPSLGLLEGYRCVIVATMAALADAAALGDALADYVDQGGAVVLTFASFVSGFELQGRFASEGYSPFTFGAGMAANSTLGNYDSSHPIMSGVTSAQSPLYGSTGWTAGAQWVADWSGGAPFIGTMGTRVVGINMTIMDLGGWPGSNTENVGRLVHNAALWASGGSICWVKAEPSIGAVAPHSSTSVTVTFSVGLPLCVTEGSYDDTLLVESNVPSSPRIAVPLHLLVTAIPDTIAPVVQVTAPNGGEMIGSGESREIRWTASDDRGVDTVSVYISYDGGLAFELLTGAGPNDSIYAWTVPETYSDSCLVRVVAYDEWGLSGSDTSDSLFAVVNVTGVDGGETPVAATRLSQNYPNPLNPTTRIDFSLREPGRVSLGIYDAAGRLVRVLLDEPRKAGFHSVTWDGRDERGVAVASGIYFCRMKSGAFVATRKMVLLR